jgi:hypothetical protein
VRGRGVVCASQSAYITQSSVISKEHEVELGKKKKAVRAAAFVRGKVSV